MYAVTGITGKVGGSLARSLLTAGEQVRAIVRDFNKAKEWSALGCEIVVADMQNSAALASAFTGATAVFILPPSEFDPAPGYPEARAVIHSVTQALSVAGPRRVLCLSTIGADAPQDNLLSQRTLMESALATLPIPLTILRPAWFIDNAAWDVPSARDAGLIHSFLQPTDKAIAMVAAKDVGRVAAKLIREDHRGIRIVELEGPRRISPNDLAEVFATVMGKPVRAVAVPRETWEGLFLSQGMRHPHARMRMLDGFNEGWIAFQIDGGEPIKGRTDAIEVVASLVASAEEQSLPSDSRGVPRVQRLSTR